MSTPETAGQAAYEAVPEVYRRWLRIDQPKNWNGPSDGLIRELWTEKSDEQKAFWRSLDAAQAAAAAAPALPLDGDAAELATLRALRGVVFHFAETWAELLPDLPDSYGCEMNCAEANAAADLLRAIGDDTTAGAIIRAHIEHDDEDERASHEPEDSE